MKKNKFTLIIPVYNSLNHLKKCISSIRLYMPDINLVIVDNNSNKETISYIKSLKKVKAFFNKKNLGFAKAVNQGLAYANSDYIAVVNSDIIFFSDFRKIVEENFKENQSIGAFGPITNRTYGVQRIVLDEKIEKNLKELKKFANVLELKFKNDFFKVHRLVGFCFFIRKEVIKKIGFLDERFGTGCYEDFDYSLRLRQAGYELGVLKGVFVWHNHHSSFNNENHFYSCALKNREVFIDKWCRKSLEFLDEIDSYLEIPSNKILKNGKKL